jgi:hypothetical protein
MTRLPMPTPISKRSGGKLGWSMYATRPEAERAAEIARHNARLDEAQGYDWGFCTPGEITARPGGFEVSHP